MPTLQEIKGQIESDYVTVTDAGELKKIKISPEWQESLLKLCKKYTKMIEQFETSMRTYVEKIVSENRKKPLRKKNDNDDSKKEPLTPQRRMAKKKAPKKEHKEKMHEMKHEEHKKEHKHKGKK